MRNWIAVILCVLLLPVGVSAAKDDSYDQLNVMDTLETMARAYISKDLKTLDAIFHEDLTYGHTSGEVQTKREVLDVISKRNTQTFEFENSDIRILGTVAIYRGVERLEFTTGDKPTLSVRGVMWVLLKNDNAPRGWQVAARQNWPLPAARPDSK